MRGPGPRYTLVPPPPEVPPDFDEQIAPLPEPTSPDPAVERLEVDASSPSAANPKAFVDENGDYELPFYANVFAIDPGTETAGWAFFRPVKLERHQRVYRTKKPRTETLRKMGFASKAEFIAHNTDPADLPGPGEQLDYVASGYVHLDPDKVVDSKGRKYSWEIRAALIAGELIKVMNSWPIDIIISEYPEVYAHSEKGAAASNSGDLLKLAFQVGMFAQYAATSRHAYQFITVTPSRWKGNTPKKVHATRMWQRYPALLGRRAEEYLEGKTKFNIRDPDFKKPPAEIRGDNNELDAVGIADWLYRKSDWLCVPCVHPENLRTGNKFHHPVEKDNNVFYEAGEIVAPVMERSHEVIWEPPAK